MTDLTSSPGQADHIEDVALFHSRERRDHRGAVQLLWRFAAINGPSQVLTTFTRQGVLRGLHHQVAPAQQIKWLTVLEGSVYEVVVDLRRDSRTFGKWAGYWLGPVFNHNGIHVPAGCAHGYKATTAAWTLYVIEGAFSPEHARTLAWNDPSLGITWPGSSEPILSDADMRGESFLDTEYS